MRKLLTAINTRPPHSQFNKIMRVIIILIAILLSFSNQSTAQTRTIYGRVVAAEDVDVIPGVRIQNNEKLLLGTTGRDGRFKIDIPQSTQILLLSFIGYERAVIKLNGDCDCDTIEVVMMLAGTYDFMSSRKVDRFRLLEFNKLPELHLQAYKKGIFKKESICYTREFKPDKPQLDSIGKEDVKIRRQIKSTFKKLIIGDTVKIPFSDRGGYRADGTDRTTLTAYYSYSGGHRHSGCIITCIVTGKNKHKRAYNIVCKVVNCGRCKDPSVFNGKVMKTGEVFTYNMKYGEILDE
jgi:hypothetical protein